MPNRTPYQTAVRLAHLKALPEFDELLNPTKVGTLSGINVAGMDAASKNSLVLASASRIPQISDQGDLPQLP
jgi:hypothetical protein